MIKPTGKTLSKPRNNNSFKKKILKENPANETIYDAKSFLLSLTKCTNLIITSFWVLIMEGWGTNLSNIVLCGDSLCGDNF